MREKRGEKIDVDNKTAQKKMENERKSIPESGTRTTGEV